LTDVLESRIKLAKQLGADYALDVRSKEPEEIEKMVEECFGEKPHVAIECSGSPSAIRAAIRVSCCVCFTCSPLVQQSFINITFFKWQRIMFCKLNMQ
jgi:Zn-dependent alcohol dehydrogenase